MTCQQRKYLILDVINALKQPAAVAWCRWRTFIRCNKCFEATGDIEEVCGGAIAILAGD